MAGTNVKIVDCNGTAKYLRLLGGIPETKGMKSGYVILQPGESVGSHSTEAREEAIVVLEGILTVSVSGKPEYRAQCGQLIYIPPHTVHDMTNAGALPARYVYVVSPVLPEGSW